MNTLSYYTIYCTPEQTRKALELGAPIELCPSISSIREKKFYLEELKCWYFIPTTEQMIGWLEEQEGIDDILVAKSITRWYYDVCLTYVKSLKCSIFDSRKEATLAAIDAALEYLSQNKK